MATGARFTIEGTPSTDGGFDATGGGSIDLQLEGSPALDVRSCTYSIHAPTKDAPALTLPASGVADPPTSIVTLPIPEGVFSFVIRSMTNGGEPVRGADGRPDYTVNIFERIVSVRSAAGLRKEVVGERTEYDPQHGTTSAQAEMVEAIDDLVDDIAGLAGAGMTQTGSTLNVIAHADGSLVVGDDDIRLKPAYSALLDGATDEATPSSLMLRNADADVTVRNVIGAGALIGDTGVTTSGVLTLEPQALPYGSSITIDASKGSHREVVTAGNIAFQATTGFENGAELHLFVKQGAGTAPDTATFSSAVHGFAFPTGTSAALVGTSAGQIDYYVFHKRNSRFWCSFHGMLVEPEPQPVEA